MSYYLTDSIFIKNNESFVELDKKIKKITKNNWHHYLYDYGWTKLSLGWKRRLKEKENKNSCFGLLECGGEGDCLFHVISEALNSNNLNQLKLPKYDVLSLRKIAANEIKKYNFDLIIESYRLDYEENDLGFIGEWEPNEIETISQLKREIKQTGNNFWGDHILLQLLNEKLKLNTIILNSDNLEYSNIEDRCKIHPIASKELNKKNKTIIIYYLDEYHFQLIGYFDGNIMKSLFDYNEIPPILLEVYNNDCRNN